MTLAVGFNTLSIQVFPISRQCWCWNRCFRNTSKTLSQENHLCKWMLRVRKFCQWLYVMELFWNPKSRRIGNKFNSFFRIRSYFLAFLYNYFLLFLVRLTWINKFLASLKVIISSLYKEFIRVLIFEKLLNDEYTHNTNDRNLREIHFLL